MTRFVVLMNDCECTLVSIFYPDLAMNLGMMDDKVLKNRVSLDGLG